MPASIPTKIQMPMARSMIFGEIKSGKPVITVAIFARIKTSSSPISPPRIQRKADSSRH
jgi:hypothetical protein